MTTTQRTVEAILKIQLQVTSTVKAESPIKEARVSLVIPIRSVSVPEMTGLAA